MECIYILSACDITSKTKNDLEKEFECYKKLYPNWEGRSFEDFVNFKCEMFDARYNIHTYDAGYFLDKEKAADYAKKNPTDINEAGFYPYLALYSRPLDVIYADTYETTVTLFVYDATKNEYTEITDITKDPKYAYLVKAFDVYQKLPKETVTF